jgi:hypothetical protein
MKTKANAGVTCGAGLEAGGGMVHAMGIGHHYEIECYGPDAGDAACITIKTDDMNTGSSVPQPSAGADKLPSIVGEKIKEG